MEPIVAGGSPIRAQEGVDAHLVERLVRSESVYDGHFLKVRRDQVKLPDGQLAWREHIVHPGAVMIVPIADDGQLVVERQHRYPLDHVLLEFPAGKLDPGETTLDCARRELLEETGYTAREWRHLATIHTAIAYTNEAIDLFIARKLEKAGSAQLDAGEFVETIVVPFDEAIAMVKGGRITDAKTVAALLWAKLIGVR